MSEHKSRIGRREALMGLGAAALGAVVGVRHLAGGSGTSAASSARPDVAGNRLPAAGDDVRALFGPLREGSPVSTHWKIEAIYGVREGAVPVVMSTIYGSKFAVEIFRDDPDGPTPVARARGLALHLVNGGDGSSRTSELHGLGVMALGRALQERRAEGAPMPRGLRTFRERDPNGDFDVPLA